jgi:hypothetical protein
MGAEWGSPLTIFSCGADTAHQQQNSMEAWGLAIGISLLILPSDYTKR